MWHVHKGQGQIESQSVWIQFSWVNTMRCSVCLKRSISETNIGKFFHTRGTHISIFLETPSLWRDCVFGYSVGDSSWPGSFSSSFHSYHSHVHGPRRLWQRVRSSCGWSVQQLVPLAAVHSSATTLDWGGCTKVQCLRLSCESVLLVWYIGSDRMTGIDRL